MGHSQKICIKPAKVSHDIENRNDIIKKHKKKTQNIYDTNIT